MLLCQIFVHLSQPVAKDEESDLADSDDIVEIKVEPFDEDAEL